MARKGGPTMGLVDTFKEIRAAFTTPSRPKFAPERPAIPWTQSQLEESATIAPDWGYSGHRVAGVSYYQPQIEWACGFTDGRITIPHALALLEFDPENPHDKKAIKVTMQGHLVGHIPRDQQREVATVIRRAVKKHGTASCVATFREPSGDIPISILLDLGED